jgi:DNA-directed RNA polymerase alpha subunit
MKIQVIRTYDKGNFERELEKMYKDFDVTEVQTHTESEANQNRFIIYYIAIVFYREVPEVVNVKDLNLSNRTFMALSRADIKTLEDLKEAFYTGDIKYVRNLGKISIEEIERKLKEMEM